MKRIIIAAIRSFVEFALGKDPLVQVDDISVTKVDNAIRSGSES